MNRSAFVSMCEESRFLLTSLRWRKEPQMRHERAFSRYLLRCAWQDLTAPLRPHHRCWLCGDPDRRWWRDVHHECEALP